MMEQHYVDISLNMTAQSTFIERTIALL